MLKKAFDYKRWSDQRVFEALQQIDQSQHASKFRFALQQLNHMTIVEELFQARLLGVIPPHESTNTPTAPELQELERRNSQLNQWFFGYVSELEAAHLDQPVIFQFADGHGGCLSQQEILFHVINHGTYHRGAIGHALDLSNAARPADTYTAYIHEAEPSRRLGSIG